MPDSPAVACLEAGILRGYGVIRPCGRGYKIGPLFADNALLAEKLLLNLIASLSPGTPFYLDVPGPNTPAINLTGRYAMQPVFGTARMYTGEDPGFSLEKVFGVTTFELG
jgi:hypothetical protein